MHTERHMSDAASLPKLLKTSLPHIDKLGYRTDDTDTYKYVNIILPKWRLTLGRVIYALGIEARPRHNAA